MIQTTRAIANTLISLALRDHLEMTAIKLQKLLYYAHGWLLVTEKMPLLAEPLLARSFGVVVPSICLGLQQHADAPMKTLFEEFDLDIGRWREPALDSDTVAAKLLSRVMQVYGQRSTVELCNLSHQPGTPWAKTRSARRSIIANDTITKYFANVVLSRTRDSEQTFFNIGLEDIRLDAETPATTADAITLKELAEYRKIARRLNRARTKQKWKKVVKHQIFWPPGKDRGILTLSLEDNVKYRLPIRSPREMRALRNMFRNEGGISYEIISGALASEWITLAAS